MVQFMAPLPLRAVDQGHWVQRHVERSWLGLGSVKIMLLSGGLYPKDSTTFRGDLNLGKDTRQQFCEQTSETPQNFLALVLDRSAASSRDPHLRINLTTLTYSVLIQNQEEKMGKRN